MAFTNGKIFEENPENIYLVMFSSAKGSQIVNINNGQSLSIPERLPIGCLCHATNPGIKNVGTQYLYDIYCSSFHVQEIKEPPSFKVYALRLIKCKVIHGRSNNKEFFYLLPSNLKLHIKNVLQIPGKHVSLKEYICGKVVDGFIDCWVTPMRSANNGCCEWVIVPTTVLQKPCYLYSNLYIKMEKMFTNGAIGPGLGVVIGIGKIAVFKYLLNCPIHFELGSTRVCMYKIVEINGYDTAVLIKSKPVKLKRRYIETFVTENGFVLIKTIVGKPLIGKWDVNAPSPRKNCLTPGLEVTVTPPNFNYSNHPFFGKILFSPNMIWSSPTLKVLIGGILNSNCDISSSSKGHDFFLYYHVLGFHDSERYWRVPDVPTEMFDSKNYLIENGVPMWGGESKNAINQLHPPPKLSKCRIEGRFVSNQFIKHSEHVGADYSDSESEESEEDEMYVTKGHLQISRKGK